MARVEGLANNRDFCRIFTWESLTTPVPSLAPQLSKAEEDACRLGEDKAVLEGELRNVQADSHALAAGLQSEVRNSLASIAG